MPFIIVIIAFAAVWYFFMTRARLLVRAFVFIDCVVQGNTVEHANRLAARVDMHASNQLRGEAMLYVNGMFNGKQLALISHARLLGYNG